MSAYDRDCRVVPHSDGTWMVFDDDRGGVEYNVAPMRDLGTLAVIPGVFAAFDGDGNPLGSEGPFDTVVHSLIGPPR